MAALQCCSKDRFAAKRLRAVADELSPVKRDVIQKNSAFSSLLNVSPFNVPNELVDFVAFNTDPKLREFHYRHKRIVFTKQMVSKVYGIRSGSKPVLLLGKSDQSAMRDAYKGGLAKLPIKNDVKMLKGFEDNAVDSIIRTWDLLCVATVLNPGTGNMMLLDYLGSMYDPKKTHEFAWDEHLLELAMQSVDRIQKKIRDPVVLEKDDSKPEFWISGPIPLLVTIYMDHLDYPPNEHIFNYSVPRVCFVNSNDFSFIVATDIDKLILNNKSIFGRRPFLDISNAPYAILQVDGHGRVAPTVLANDHVQVDASVEETEVNPSASLNEWLAFPSCQELEVPARFKQLYDKHKDIFDSDVDATLKSLATGLKSMQALHMSSLLVDVDAALRSAEEVPTVVFPRFASSDKHPNLQTSLGSQDEAGSKVVKETVVATASDVSVIRVAARDACARVVEQKDVEVPVLARNVVPPDLQQEAVLIDSTLKEVDSGLQDDVNSPTRFPLPVMPVPRSPTDFGSGYWDHNPSFNLSSKDDFYADARVEASTPEAVAPTTVGTHISPAAKGVAESVKQGKELDISNEVVVPYLVPSTVTTDAPMQVGTPDLLNPKDLATTEAIEKPASTRIATIDRKNRYKRAAKADDSTPKLKKLKVYEDVNETYLKFVAHGRIYKKGKKKNDEIPKPFILIGRNHCSYKSFQMSLKPRQNLDTQVMSVWLENFNKSSKGKYAFSCFLTLRLSGDTESFNAKDCMNEFKQQYAQYKFLKDGVLYFPLVANNHWIVCCVNMVYKQFHTFDSYRGSKNRSILQNLANRVFTNFCSLVDQSKVVKKINWTEFQHTTPDHPQQNTIYDCGYFCMLYMEHFNARVMLEFDSDAIPSYRKIVSARLIEARENEGEIVSIMEEDLM